MASKAIRYTPPKRPADLTLKKGTLLYLFLIPLFISVIFALFQVNISAFLFNLSAFVLFYGALYLSKMGFEQEAKYHAAVFARAPKHPCKAYGGIILSGATFFTAFVAGEESLVKSLFFSVVAFLGYYLYYGFDPREDKLPHGEDVSASYLLETLEEAKKKMVRLRERHADIEDVALAASLGVAIDKSEEMIEAIEADPKIVRTARKFLIVYLDGVVNVIDSYVSLQQHQSDAVLRERLATLMTEVEEKFSQEQKRLKSGEHFDLDVRIDTLKAQMK